MQNFKYSDKALNSLIDEFNDYDINLIIYVARYFKDLQHEIDLFAEKSKTDNRLSKIDIDKINQDREEMINYIDECKTQCLLRCQENQDKFQLKLDFILQLFKQPNEQLNSTSFSLSYEQKISELNKLSFELRKDIFKKNLIFLNQSFLDSCNASCKSQTCFKLFIIEPFCMDDIQIESFL